MTKSASPTLISPLASFFSVRNAVAFLIGILLISYVIVPTFASAFVGYYPYFYELIWYTAIGCICAITGYLLPICDGRFSISSWRLTLDIRYFHIFVWITFVALVALMLSRGNPIPLLSAFQGANAEDLSQQRAGLLKTLLGRWVALNYIMSVYTSVLVPLSLAASFVHSERMRWWMFTLFLLYCELSLERALFIKATIPLLYVSLIGQGRNGRRFGVIVLVSIVLLIGNTYLARGPFSSQGLGPDLSSDLGPLPGGDTVPTVPGTALSGPAVGNPVVNQRYFTPRYSPSGTLDAIVWRLTAVPLFSAADSLAVFYQKFEGMHFMGATSSFLAFAFGLSRVPFEAVVQGMEFGGRDISPFGRTNSVFVIEAFVNFGIVGIVVFAMFIGQSLRWLVKSGDEALQSLWGLYVINLWAAGLIGTLLSNGFVLVFAMCLLGRFVVPERRGGSLNMAVSSER